MIPGTRNWLGTGPCSCRQGGDPRCRTDQHRLSFAIQLCVLRVHGRFLSDFDVVGVRITNHLCRQLNLPPVLLSTRPGRSHRPGHQRRIREYLGVRPFGPAAQERLEREVQALAEQGHPVVEVFAAPRGCSARGTSSCRRRRPWNGSSPRSRPGAGRTSSTYRRPADAGGPGCDRGPRSGARGGPSGRSCSSSSSTRPRPTPRPSSRHLDKLDRLRLLGGRPDRPDRHRHGPGPGVGPADEALRRRRPQAVPRRPSGTLWWPAS